MERVYVISRPYALAMASKIRDRTASPEELHTALLYLGHEVATAIVEQFYLSRDSIRTPLDIEVVTSLPRFPLTVTMTTKEDLEPFATELAKVIGNCEVGWMNFAGRRGFDALNADVRDMSIPQLRAQRVDSLLVAKATLATGCTAVNLTRTAYAQYTPDRLIIASIFYSVRGLEMLRAEFPNAHIFVVGEPDDVNDEGLLVPGIGLLAERLAGGGGE